LVKIFYAVGNNRTPPTITTDWLFAFHPLLWQFILTAKRFNKSVANIT